MIRFESAALLLLLSAATAARAAPRSEPVEWELDGRTFSGVVVYDDAGDPGPRPGVLMVPNWMGVGEHALSRARALAGDGRVVLVADVYGKGVRPGSRDEARQQVMQVYSDGGATLRRRVAAAVEALARQADRVPVDPGRIAAIGFCFGGSAVLELARSGTDVAGVVSVHGGLETHLPTEGNRITAPVLVLNGAEDASVSDAHIAAFGQEMDAAGADWQFVDFGGARHCFSQEEDAGADPQDNCRYDARAARRAFVMIDAFFEEIFEAGPR
ncbi:dienelactone hydrolase family protein [Luteimonas sp. RD2P54]|uniref:Dienelactone hydrolase family protein n=1 Tax=Luteimonas endophytica TaxID=3042023 RepID=A0ABT6JB49_9GAMM|nr:dienelactone hydrolase family protein [Luteimonas endophytica]MDH5824051.1 dienelactone hydrolase family protein [Luteimonas endophytica]